VASKYRVAVVGTGRVGALWESDPPTGISHAGAFFVQPDCVLGFSDLQADIAAVLVKRGVQVTIFNQRSVAEIFAMLYQVAAMVGRADDGLKLLEGMRERLLQVEAAGRALPRRPRVFFEEWDEPLISGIRWVEELVAIAGGTPIFPELAAAGLAKDRIVDPAEVARRDPQVIFASWCGKKMKKATIQSRPGWHATSAVRDDRIFEIKSTYILQPGPASLTDGVRQIHDILASLA